MESAVSNDKGRHLLVGLFVAALLTHAWLVFFNLHMPFLAGHEFRQSQTALITYYIDKDNNFSPFYEQPIFGKPWVSFILEFPLYQWTVVGVSRATGWPHFLSARIISISCFYATLPALFLLLGRLGFEWRRRLLALAFVLLCPGYIFYTRAFLIDPMALMFSVWFVAGFVKTMDERRYTWLTFTIIAGVCGALVKSVVFAVWTIPAACYGAWLLWRSVRSGQGWKPPIQTALWGASTVVLSLGLLKWWVAATDVLKESNPSTTIFTAKALSEGNWGLFGFSGLFSRELWTTQAERWSEVMMNPWVLFALVAVAVVFLSRYRWKILALTALFFLPQCLFPYAYAYQDYYFYSCAAFMMGALGIAAVGLWDSRLPRWLALGAIVAVLGVQVKNYWRCYRPQQASISMGRHAFTDNIRDITPANDVIIIAGYDWAAMIPYYSERRALMIRYGMENDLSYLEKAYQTLEDETVHTLIVGPLVRTNQRFIDYTVRMFDLDPVPVFSNSWGDVYVSRFYVNTVLGFINGSRNRFAADTIFPERIKLGRRAMRVTANEARRSFSMVTPGPAEIDFEYGLATATYEGNPVLCAHTDSLIRLKPPPAAKVIEMEYGIINEAWNKPDGKTNGIEFVVYVEVDGQPRVPEIYRRVLDPAQVPGDRGLQKISIDYTPKPGERLCFAALSNGSKAFDWGYWKRITVR